MVFFPEGNFRRNRNIVSPSPVALARIVAPSRSALMNFPAGGYVHDDLVPLGLEGADPIPELDRVVIIGLHSPRVDFLCLFRKPWKAF